MDHMRISGTEPTSLILSQTCSKSQINIFKNTVVANKMKYCDMVIVDKGKDI